MHTPAGPAFLVWLETSGLAAAMRQDEWLYPIVEILHIAGFVVLVGSVAMFDLRLLGAARHLPIAGLAQHLLPWSLGSLLVVVPSGFLMFAAHATEFVGNPAFLLKLALLAAAAVNAAWFHRTTFRSVAAWNAESPVPVAGRAAAGVSLALWIGVICCGRLIAYL